MVLVPIEQYNHWKKLTVAKPTDDTANNLTNEILNNDPPSDIPHEKIVIRKKIINKQSKKDIVNKNSQKILSGTSQLIKKKKKKNPIKHLLNKKNKKVSTPEGRPFTASFSMYDWIKL